MSKVRIPDEMILNEVMQTYREAKQKDDNKRNTLRDDLVQLLNVSEAKAAIESYKQEILEESKK